MNGHGRFGKGLERAAAVAAIWPVAVLLSNGRFRKSWPCLAGRLAVVLGAYGLSAIAIIAVVPGGRLFILALTAAALTYERWCAWPKSGLAGLLPPGSLAFGPIDSCADQGFSLKQAAKHGPVFKTRSLGAPGAFGNSTACVLGHDKGPRPRRDHGDAIKTTDDRRWTPFDQLIPRGFIRYMDPDDHAHYRDVFRSVLGPRVIVPNLPFPRSAADGSLARMSWR